MATTEAALQNFFNYWNSVKISAAIELSSTALLFYDYLLTLPQEINNIWGRKFTLPTMLFLLNRYFSMIDGGLRTVQAISWEGYTEDDANRLSNHMEICLVITAIRIFAIWDRNRVIFAFVLGIGLINPISTCYYTTTFVYSAFPPPLNGCVQHRSTLDNGSILDSRIFLGCTLCHCDGARYSVLVEILGRGNLGGTLRLGDDDEEQEEEEGECGDGYVHEYGPVDDCETMRRRASFSSVVGGRNLNPLEGQHVNPQ
ncbi:hypothetical protein BDY19DRAFT_1051727 [Irpex rosettiformis]|uniref:Uncharacterized protein n=1 Tax=Irpex rosettiformis TaxID=378272 RepID=A0ACB8TNV4_9APHY|nr:hypothetical protein BDY19DRAFT_1051727 [Irpex rosettiformis]